MRTFLILLSSVLIVSGCSGPSAGRDDSVPDDRVERVSLSDTETFDAARYVDEPAVLEEVVHDVPEALMTSTAARDVRTVRRVQGFRIQIHSSLERKSALEVEENVVAWWRGMPVDSRPIDYRPVELPVEMRFVTPYYRVRIGAFESRAEAEAFLGFLNDRYAGAFPVLDTITVIR